MRLKSRADRGMLLVWKEEEERKGEEKGAGERRRKLKRGGYDRRIMRKWREEGQ